MCGKGLPLQSNGIESDMDQNLCSLCTGQRNRMTGIENHRHLSVCRGINLSLGGDHRKAVSQYLFGESRIRNILQSNHLSLTGCVDKITFCLSLEKS